MLSTAIGIVAGGLITILTTIAVEALRRPQLKVVLAPAGDRAYGPGRPAKQVRYLHLYLENEPLPQLARWMSRDAALQCSGVISFHHLDGQRFFVDHMPIRFSRSPEPVAMPILIDGRPGFLADPSRMSAESRIDIYPGERTPFDVAAKFDSESDAYGWSNLNYFSTPPWRHPDWKLPQGRFLVAITISSSGRKCRGLFRLLNEGAPKDFRLEEALPEDHKTSAFAKHDG